MKSYPHERKILIIDQKSQLTLLLYTVFICGVVIVVGNLIQHSLQLAQEASVLTNMQRSWMIFAGFLAVFLMISSFVVGIILSNRFAGPVYAIRRHLRWLLDENKIELVHLRQGDMFEDLATDFNQLLIRIQKGQIKVDLDPSKEKSDNPHGS